MTRREFIAITGLATTASSVLGQHPVSAQPATKIWRVGMLDTSNATLNARNVEAFRRELRKLGYVENQNLVIEYRSADGDIGRFPNLAAELVQLNVDIIVTRGTPAARAAKKATATIPIVMASIGEPVETGMVASLAKPGGNVTGLSGFVTELTGKRIEIIRELVPHISRIGLLDNMGNRSVPAQWGEMEKVSRSMGIEPHLHDIRKKEDIEGALDAATADRDDALSVGNDGIIIANRLRIVELAASHRLPAIYATREMVDAGGLISYAPSYPDLYRRAAHYVAKIFQGANPADLPVEDPTKFELVINLKASKSLGLAVPPMLLAQADEVIE